MPIAITPSQIAASESSPPEEPGEASAETGPTDPGPAAAQTILEPGQAPATGGTGGGGAGGAGGGGGSGGDDSDAAIWLGVIAIGIAALAVLATGFLWSTRPATLPAGDEDDAP